MKITRAAAGCLVLALCSAAPHAAGPIDLRVPGRANAHVSLASDGNFLAAVWSASTPDGVTDIYAASGTNGGATFGAPVRVNATSGEARVNGEQPPRLTLISRNGGVPEIVVLWTAKGSAGTLLLTARSADGGRTFGKSVLVPGTDAQGNRGWEAIGADAGGNVYAAWLDHRRMARQETAMPAGHQHGAHTPAAKPQDTDGAAMAQQSDLYVARLDGRSSPMAVTRGVCYCCKTAVAFGPSSETYVAWRHVYPGNLRDIAFTLSKDGRAFAEPLRVSEDRWEIAGCPDDGPAMTVERGGRIHLVWPTVVTERGEMVKALFHASSADGRAFSPRQRIPTRGQANHPQLGWSGDGSLIVAWDESGDGSRRIALARGRTDRRGAIAFSRIDAAAARIGTYPSLARTASGFGLAWTTGDPATSVIRVEEVK